MKVFYKFETALVRRVVRYTIMDDKDPVEHISANNGTVIDEGTPNWKDLYDYSILDDSGATIYCDSYDLSSQRTTGPI